MKITKIELKNFLGLYNGSGKKSIKIDFTKGSDDNKITILSGGNGKGKTFLISCLHPFASTLDGRSKIIIDGENGYKEIHYDINSEKKAIIKHHYNQGRNGKITMKSFFSLSEDAGQSYTELNPNGTVTSFKNLVLQHLEVDESYFKIARVGTNVTNFIDMPTAERKKYISLFLPDVDIYLENYKKINEKYNALNKNIKFITQEINKLDDEENLKSNLENNESTLKRLNSISESLLKKLNTNLGQIAIIDPEGLVEKTFLEEYNKFNKLKTKNVNLKDQYDDLKNELPENISWEDVVYEISNINTSLNTLNEKLTNLNIRKQKAESELEEKNTLLVKMSLDDEEEIKSLLEKTEENIQSLESVLKSNEYQNLLKYKDIELHEIKRAIDMFNYYCQSTSDILGKYDIGIVEHVFSNTPNDSLESVNAEISELKKQISNDEIKRRTLMSKVELVDVLSSRPSNCKIDTCPFISKALEFKNVESDIAIVEKEIDKTNKILSEKQQLKEFIIDVNSLKTDISNLFNYMNKEVELLSKLPYYELYNSYENFVSNFRKDKSIFTNLTSILSLVEVNKELQSELSQLNMLKMKMDYMKTQKDSVNIIKRDCTRLEAECEEIIKDITKINEDISPLEEKLIENELHKTKLESINKLNDEIKETSDEIKQLSVSLNKMKNDISILKKHKKENREYEEELEKIKKQILPLEKEKERLSLNLRRLNDFTESKKKLEKDYYDLAIIRDALSNTKGIPLLFIELYLKKIKTIANELLDISFNGKFFIEDFIVTESDFFISVRKSEGELVGDISQASQGEQALTSIALSFALVQQSTRSYNVLALDEMDSTLDSNNRRAFIDVIEAQLKEMNVEQCFIISHNEAFDTYPVNLILFEGTNVDINDKEYMKNKKVLYQNK